MDKLYEEAGKGDKQRPTDHAKYASNYDAIFRKNIPEGHMANVSSEEEVDTDWGSLDEPQYTNIEVIVNATK
jgi:hypothetical protein